MDVLSVSRQIASSQNLNIDLMHDFISLDIENNAYTLDSPCLIRGLLELDEAMDDPSISDFDIRRMSGAIADNLQGYINLIMYHDE